MRIDRISLFQRPREIAITRNFRQHYDYSHVVLRKANYILLCILYFLALQYGYIHYISIEFDYLLYLPPIDYNNLKGLISFFALLATCLITPLRQNSCSSYILILFMVSIFIPTISLYGIINGNNSCFWSVVASYIFMLLGCEFFRNLKIKGHNAKNFKEEVKILNMCILFSIFTCALVVAFGGLNYFNINLDLLYVYIAREEIKHSVLNNTLISYTTYWSAKLLLPAAIIISIQQKKYTIMFFAMMLQLFLYFIFFHKVFLFVPVFCIIIYYMLKKYKTYSWLLLGSTILIVVLYYLYTNEMKGLPALFLRRTFYVPAIANYSYYDYFADMPMDMLRSVFPLRLIFDSPYSTGFQVAIGTDLEGGKYSMMNANFLASGYAHFKEPGTVLFGFIVGVIIGIFDAVISKSYNRALAMSIITLGFYTMFTSSDLFTSLLTHGILFSLYFVYLFAINDQYKTSHLVSYRYPKEEKDKGNYKFIEVNEK